MEDEKTPVRSTEEAIAETLANEHWEYVAGVIREEWKAFEAVGHDAKYLDSHSKILAFHYKTAFMHGYRHGKASQEHYYYTTNAGLELMGLKETI